MKIFKLAVEYRSFSLSLSREENEKDSNRDTEDCFVFPFSVPAVNRLGCCSNRYSASAINCAAWKQRMKSLINVGSLDARHSVD